MPNGHLTFSQLASVLLCAAEQSNTDYEAVQSAFYLAQRTARKQLYDYHLALGQVVSDDLAADFQSALGFRDQIVCKDVESMDELRSLTTELKRWLAEGDTAVLQATATAVFFRVQDYGEPEANLRWFRGLPEGVRTRADELATSVTSEDSVVGITKGKASPLEGTYQGHS
jgi:hypothetical protein